MKLRRFTALFLIFSELISCGKEEPAVQEEEVLPEIEEEKATENPYTEGTKYGIKYIYDRSVIPDIHLSVTAAQWDALLNLYEANHDTKQYVHCDVTYMKGGEKTSITDAGLRLRGNTSRRYPGADGVYHHCHYGLNLRKYHKDDDHEIHGARKINLKWFKDDPSYTREIFCFDLFRRDTVWTAVHAEYCRLYLKVEGDIKESFLGVYQMQEPIDTRYLKERKDAFGSADGNLWKCRYGATMAKMEDWMFGLDAGTDKEWVYECKSEDNDFEAAKAQFKDFMTKIREKTGKDFQEWFGAHCDVELLLRTYAVNVACGMWDDYWNNCNNYYVYFNSTDIEDYKFFFIPFDYDNTLGTSGSCGIQTDSGRQDPLYWGQDSNFLIKKVLSYIDWREFYKKELLKLADPNRDFLDPEAAGSRIKEWQSRIRESVPNDTGEDMKIRDIPASWGNHPEYRILEDGANNFFSVKIETINNYCK